MRYFKYWGYIIFSALFIVILPLLVWMGQFYNYPISNNTARWSEFGSFVGGTVTPILTLLSVIGLVLTIIEQKKQLLEAINQHNRAENIQQERRDNEIYFKQAIQLLESSYDAIKPDIGSTTPKQNNLAWLTCSRLLVSAQEFSEKITEKSIKQSYNQYEETTRLKLYELFNTTGGNHCFSISESYFSDPRSTFRIHPKAIIIIYRFIESDHNDPLDRVVGIKKEDINSLFSQVEFMGVKNYLHNQNEKLLK